MKDWCRKACFVTSGAILSSPASLCTASATAESQHNLGWKESNEVTCSNPAQSRGNVTKTKIVIKKKTERKKPQPTELLNNLIYLAAVVHGFRS